MLLIRKVPISPHCTYFQKKQANNEQERFEHKHVPPKNTKRRKLIPPKAQFHTFRIDSVHQSENSSGFWMHKSTISIFWRDRAHCVQTCTNTIRITFVHLAKGKKNNWKNVSELQVSLFFPFFKTKYHNSVKVHDPT